MKSVIYKEVVIIDGVEYVKKTVDFSESMDRIAADDLGFESDAEMSDYVYRDMYDGF